MEYEINILKLPSAEELENLYLQTTWARKRSKSNIYRLLENVTVFVAVRKDSDLIGFGRAISDGIYRALIDDIIVDSSYRQKGIGKLIIINILKQLEDVEEIFLNTKPDLEEFYMKFGFKKVSTITMKK